MEEEGGGGLFVACLPHAACATQVDPNSIASYLPLEACLKGLGTVSEAVLGLRLVEQRLPPEESWAPGVRKLILSEVTAAATKVKAPHLPPSSAALENPFPPFPSFSEQCRLARSRSSSNSESCLCCDGGGEPVNDAPQTLIRSSNALTCGGLYSHHRCRCCCSWWCYNPACSVIRRSRGRRSA